MTRKPELCGRGCYLPRTIRLHDAAGHEGVGSGVDCFDEHIVELAQLVAAETDARATLPFDPEPRPAEMRREALHGLQGRRKMRKPDPAKLRQAGFKGAKS